jgi:dienelactone hydrolase
MSKLKIIILLVIPLFFINCSVKKNTNANLNTSGVKTEQKSPKQGFNRDNLTITTSDNITLSCTYSYEDGKKETTQPIIVLIHQFNQDKDQWPDSFTDKLINENYKVFTYDIRGHGSSSKVNFDLDKLLTSREEAPKDLIAVFEWLKQQRGVDSTNIGVMGTSIGGNLACYARYYLGAKAVVSVSNSKDGYFAFMDIDERMMSKVFPRISNVLLICGKNDGNHAADEQYLIDNYIDKPKDIKVIDSDKHGIFLIQEHPEIYQDAIDWFKKFL